MDTKLNQNEVNLILSRLESIENNQIKNQDRVEKWIARVEDNYTIISAKFERRLSANTSRLDKMGTKIGGIVSIIGVIATFVGAWINKHFL